MDFGVPHAGHARHDSELAGAPLSKISLLRRDFRVRRTAFVPILLSIQQSLEGLQQDADRFSGKKRGEPQRQRLDFRND